MDGWVANCADGSTHAEDWIPGYLSPWQRLMDYCKRNHTYVSALRMNVGGDTVALPANAKGYWQAVGMPAVQGVECDEDLHKFKGIGFVEEGTVYIVWGARDPATHQVVFWRDQRDSHDQAQIIYAPVVTDIIPLEETMEVVRSQQEVKNLKKFTDKIIGD